MTLRRGDFDKTVIVPLRGGGFHEVLVYTHSKRDEDVAKTAILTVALMRAT